MGWTAYYQLLSDEPLGDDETRTLGDVIVRARTKPWDAEPFRLAVTAIQRPDRLVAHGWNKLAENLEASSDAERLTAALTEIVTLLPMLEVRLEDDLGILGWSETERRFALGEPPTAPLIEVADEAGFEPAETFATPPQTKLPKKLVAALAAAHPAIGDAVVSQALSVLVELDDRAAERARIQGLLEHADPALVAAVGLRRYAAVNRSWQTWDLVIDAIDRAGDFAPLVEPFVGLWSNPKGIYYYGDMRFPDRFLDSVATAPSVLEVMATDLTDAEAAAWDDDLAYRRAQAAANMIARGRTDRGLAVLTGVIGRQRERARTWRAGAYLYEGAHEALARFAVDRRVTATLALHLGEMTRVSLRTHSQEIVALARLDSERARSIVMRLADLGIYLGEVAEALGIIGGDDAIARLQQLADYPLPRVRQAVAAALQHLGAAIPAAPDPSPAEELCSHPDPEVRREALLALSVRKDTTLFVSLVLGLDLDRRLRHVVDDPALPFSWYDWDQILPREVIEMGSAGKLEWAAGAGAKALGEQVILPALAPVRDQGADGVAATYPNPLFCLEPAERAALLSEEAEFRAALGNL